MWNTIYDMTFDQKHSFQRPINYFIIKINDFLFFKITPRRKETGELHSILKDDLLIWAGAG